MTLNDNSLTIHKCIWDITTYILTKPNISIILYYNNANVFGVQIIDNKFKNTEIFNIFHHTSYKDRCDCIEQMVDIINTINNHIQLQINVNDNSFDKKSIMALWDNTDHLQINIINNTLLPHYENLSRMTLFYKFLFTTQTIDDAINNYNWIKSVEKNANSTCKYDWPKDIDDIKHCLKPLNPYGITMEIDLTEIEQADDYKNNNDDYDYDYDNKDNEEEYIDYEKHIILDLFLNIYTGNVTVAIKEHTPIMWDIPTADITYDCNEILKIDTPYSYIGQAIENNLNQSNNHDNYTAVIYRLKDLIHIICNIAYRNKN